MLMEDRFDLGKEIVEETWNDFESSPDDLRIEEGIMRDHDAAAISSMKISSSSEDQLEIFDKPEIQWIAVDKDLVEERPNAATKSIVHELVEIRAAEEFGVFHLEDDTPHIIASWDENQVCRQMNERSGQKICDQEWNRSYDS